MFEKNWVIALVAFKVKSSKCIPKVFQNDILIIWQLYCTSNYNTTRQEKQTNKQTNKNRTKKTKKKKGKKEIKNKKRKRNKYFKKSKEDKTSTTNNLLCTVKSSQTICAKSHPYLIYILNMKHDNELRVVL